VIGCKDGGIAQYGFTDDDANIYAHLGDSFLADFHGLNKFVVIVRYNDGSMENALPRLCQVRVTQLPEILYRYITILNCSLFPQLNLLQEMSVYSPGTQ